MAVEKSTWGQVVAVGPGKRGKHGELIPCDVREGDVVIFGPYNDLEMEDLVMIQEADIRLVVEGHD
jgi:chaperonin GroES